MSGNQILYGKQKVRKLSFLSFLAAILFYAFFMASKHLPFLSNTASFLEDPYDAVGSFAVLTAVLVAIMHFFRLALIRKYQITASYLYVVRGNFNIGTAILITLLTDSVAEILAPTPITFIINDIVLFSAMGFASNLVRVHIGK